MSQEAELEKGESAGEAADGTGTKTGLSRDYTA